LTVFTATPNDAIVKAREAQAKSAGLRQRCKLLKDEALITLVKSLAVTMPFIYDGQVTIKVNFHQGRCASTSVGFESRQDAPKEVTIP
jgi:hypothetical protein